MAITTTTHLNFRGTASAALDFYRDVFKGTRVAIAYRDMGVMTEGPEADWITWGAVTSPSGFNIMAYDVPSDRPYDPGQQPVFVSVRGDDADELNAYWTRLVVGGQVIVPLAASAWSPLYGMAIDQFGVTWVLDIAQH